MEKELYYYKVQAKRYRNQLKDFVNTVSSDCDFKKDTRSIECSEEFHLPPVQDATSSKERNDRRYFDHRSLDNDKRLQVEILEFL